MRKKHPKDLTGLMFGDLKVVSLSKKIGNLQYWKCNCLCGGEKTVRRDCLLQNRTRSCGCKSGKLEKGLSSFNRLYENYINNAKKRGYSFELAKEKFKTITQQKCFYCGSEPNQQFGGIRHNGYYTYNGVDRIDNTKGYSADNVVACCKICNNAKLDLTFEEFNNWINRIIGYRKAP